MSCGKMVLPLENIIPVLQHNLGFQDDQEDIISSLNTFFWRHRRNTEHYHNASQVLEEEERRVEALERVIKRRDIWRAERQLRQQSHR